MRVYVRMNNIPEAHTCTRSCTRIGTLADADASGGAGDVTAPTPIE